MVAILLSRLALAVQETLEGEGSVPVVPGEVFTPVRGSAGLLARLQVKVRIWTFAIPIFVIARQAGLHSVLC